MQWFRRSVHLLIAAMVLVPFYQFLETESEASTAVPTTFRSGLLLTNLAAEPSLEKLRFLDRTVVVNYVVGPRESIWGIQQKFQIDEDTIRSSNMEDAANLSAGKILRIPNRRGTIYQVKAGETLDDIRQKFTWGRRDPQSFMNTVLAMNDYPVPALDLERKPLKEDSYLFLPNTTIKYWAMDIPVDFRGRLRISSGFGSRRHPVLQVTRQHHGWDLPRPYGSAVSAASSGQVISAGWEGGYGNLIVLSHAIKTKNGYNHMTTRYGHLSKILVTTGQRVKQGQLIGRVGSTGISTGPHLHFEIRDAQGRARNPKNFTH
jgi:murein DD-endopeptidase MepM/ murein hydrolase activator NlpD